MNEPPLSCLFVFFALPGLLAFPGLHCRHRGSASLICNVIVRDMLSIIIIFFFSLPFVGCCSLSIKLYCYAGCMHARCWLSWMDGSVCLLARGCLVFSFLALRWFSSVGLGLVWLGCLHCHCCCCYCSMIMLWLSVCLA